MNKIAKIFETLDYGPAPESPEPALKFGHYAAHCRISMD